MTRVAINGFGCIGRNVVRASPHNSPLGPLGEQVRIDGHSLLRVPSDIVHLPYSCIFEGELTIANESPIKVFGRRDKEWAYSCRRVDLVDWLV